MLKHLQNCIFSDVVGVVIQHAGRSEAHILLYRQLKNIFMYLFLPRLAIKSPHLEFYESPEDVTSYRACIESFKRGYSLGRLQGAALHIREYQNSQPSLEKSRQSCAPQRPLLLKTTNRRCHTVVNRIFSSHDSLPDMCNLPSPRHCCRSTAFQTRVI